MALEPKEFISFVYIRPHQRPPGMQVPRIKLFWGVVFMEIAWKQHRQENIFFFFF